MLKAFLLVVLGIIIGITYFILRLVWCDDESYAKILALTIAMRIKRKKEKGELDEKSETGF